MTTKDELLEQLPSDPEALVAVAQSTNDVKVLDALANLPIGELRYAVVSNPACHAATLTRIARELVPEMPDSPLHWNERIMSLVRFHENTPMSVTLTLRNHNLSPWAPPRNLWSHERALSIAQYPNAPERSFGVACRDPRSDVRLACAQNPTISVGDLWVLSRDETAEVRETAKQRLVEQGLLTKD